MVKINKNKPKNKGRARHGKVNKFKSSFATKRTSQKMTKKIYKQEKRQFSLKKKQNRNQNKSDVVPEVTNRQKRVQQKEKRKQSDSIIKTQIQDGLKKNLSLEKLKQLVKGIQMRGLKQRLNRKISNKFETKEN